MAKKYTEIQNTAIYKLTKAINELGATQGLSNVFTLFLEVFANSLAALSDLINNQKRKQRYDELVKQMDSKTNAEYANLCQLMFNAVLENADDPIDIIGNVFHELKLNNAWNGQFFTPDYVGRLMASMINSYELDEITGLITVHDTTCGSGTLLIAYAGDMLQKGIDYTKKAIFIGMDIDIRCVWMAYIQLTLYKMPAVIIHADSLNYEIWDEWYTPFYFEVTRGLKNG